MWAVKGTPPFLYNSKSCLNYSRRYLVTLNTVKYYLKTKQISINYLSRNRTKLIIVLDSSLIKLSSVLPQLLHNSLCNEELCEERDSPLSQLIVRFIYTFLRDAVTVMSLTTICCIYVMKVGYYIPTSSLWDIDLEMHNDGYFVYLFFFLMSFAFRK